MQHYRSKSGSGRIGEGDAHSSGSKYAANKMGEDYPTGDRNDADGIIEDNGTKFSTLTPEYTLDVENLSSDIADTDNGVHGGVEAYGSSVEEFAHENKNGFDSREKNDVRSIRNGRAPGSRTGTKGMNNFHFAQISLICINITWHSYRPLMLMKMFYYL